jgi:23S rRNA (guanosine2251-2'-O)-methyltransferase
MREDFKQEMIYGIRPVIEAIDSDKEVEKVFVQKGLQSSTLRELMVLLRERNIPYQIVPIEKLKRISRKNHQGLLLMFLPSIFTISRICFLVFTNRAKNLLSLF